MQAGRSPGLVRVRERVENAADDVQRERNWQEDLPLAAAGQHHTQIAAVHVLHGQVVHLAHHARLEHLDDVGVLEQARDVRLHGEEIDCLGVGSELRREPLERDHLAGARSFHDARLVDLRHAAAPEQLQDLEPAEPRRRLGHTHGARPRLGAPGTPSLRATFATRPESVASAGSRVASRLCTGGDCTGGVHKRQMFALTSPGPRSTLLGRGGIRGELRSISSRFEAAIFPLPGLRDGRPTSCPIAVQRGPVRACGVQAPGLKRPTGEA